MAAKNEVVFPAGARIMGVLEFIDTFDYIINNTIVLQFWLILLKYPLIPHEQTGFMVAGKMTLYIDQEEFLVEPGDSWSIPRNVEHRAEVMEDSVAIEVFSPVRENYLPRGDVRKT